MPTLLQINSPDVANCNNSETHVNQKYYGLSINHKNNESISNRTPRLTTTARINTKKKLFYFLSPTLVFSDSS